MRRLQATTPSIREPSTGEPSSRDADLISACTKSTQQLVEEEGRRDSRGAAYRTAWRASSSLMPCASKSRDICRASRFLACSQCSCVSDLGLASSAACRLPLSETNIPKFRDSVKHDGRHGACRQRKAATRVAKLKAFAGGARQVKWSPKALIEPQALLEPQSKAPASQRHPELDIRAPAPASRAWCVAALPAPAPPSWQPHCRACHAT